MSGPIRAGDRAEVVWGLLGAKSPNLGLVVKVLAQQGEHSQHGVMWLCQAEYAVIAQTGTRDISPDCAHFAQSWLRKIEPPAAESPGVERSVAIPY